MNKILNISIRDSIYLKAIFFTLFVLATTLAQSQTLDPSWKKGVVLFEMKRDTTFFPVGTGVVVFYNKFSFLVTNNHVAKLPGLYLRLNLKANHNRLFRFQIDEVIFNTKEPWFYSSEGDVAVIPISFPTDNLGSNSIDVLAIGTSLFKKWDYPNEGDDVYILGFPIGIGTGQHYSPVYRSGIIALKEKKNEFLIDANIYPGNSGGPVFMKPSIYDYRNNSFGQNAPGYLIGIVSSYLPYQDIAISQQTQRPRIIFEENSGLAVVYSTDVILNALAAYVKKYSIK